MKKQWTICTLFLLIISQSFGQFTLKADFRPRFEYRGGYGEILSKEESPILTISERARLSAFYQTGIFSFGFGIQDVRVWGDDNISGYTGVTGSSASIDLNEGWIGIRPYPDGMLKIGRQHWIYEDERIFSLRSWNQGEMKYDAFLFSHKDKNIQVDVGLSWNNLAENFYDRGFPTDRMKTLDFLYLKKEINDWLYLSAFGILSGFNVSDTIDTENNDLNLQGTYALYVGIDRVKVKVLVSGYYQNGKNRSGLKTSAYMFSVKADYGPAKKISAGAGIDYLSGHNHEKTDPGYKGRNHCFDNLYGARHRVFGNLDYFNNLPKSTGNGGLVDIFLKFNYSFVEKAGAGIDLHYFALQNNVVDKYAGMNGVYYSKTLGAEADLYISWDLAKFINLKGGYSFFLATDSMEKLQGVYGNARFPTWVWLMITAKPVFFDTAAR